MVAVCKLPPKRSWKAKISSNRKTSLICSRQGNGRKTTRDRGRHSLTRIVKALTALQLLVTNAKPSTIAVVLEKIPASRIQAVKQMSIYGEKPRVGWSNSQKILGGNSWTRKQAK